ncbi:MAG: tyrosine-type recombinase/integrase [Syntrophobacteraceae bacterium]
MSRRRKPLNRRTAWLTIRKYGDLAGLELPASPHPQRHACGFFLADQGADTRLIQDYLASIRRLRMERWLFPIRKGHFPDGNCPGHRDIRHTVIYTATNPAMFERLWR